MNVLRKIGPNNWVRIAGILLVLVVLTVLNLTMGRYSLRILNLAGIYIILGLSLNLINGFTGLFSLGHAGFIAIGAYTSVLLTLSPEKKELYYFVEPIVPILKDVDLPFWMAMLAGGLVSAVIGAIISAPILRLKDDYLAIATLGFSEIIRVVFTNTQSITNGALGIKGLDIHTNVYYSWGGALVLVMIMYAMRRSSYGKAFMAIREDEVAAESMGINLLKHKVLAFAVGSFFAGIGGALLVHLVGSVDPNLFKFTLTFNILLIVVLGGIGSITGTVISAVLVTVALEALRFLDESINFGFFVTDAVPGLRMVLFSLTLMVVILFYRKGLFGKKELTTDLVLDFVNRKRGVK